MLGFTLVSVAPIGMQYALKSLIQRGRHIADLYPIVGQISVVFVYIMEALKSSDGSFTPGLLLAAGLLLLSSTLILNMKDPTPVPAAV